MRLIRSYECEIAHQLSAGVPEGHQCRRLHGHRYEVEIVVIGTEDPETGMLLEYNAIDVLCSSVIGLLDHRFINLLGYEATVEQGRGYVDNDLLDVPIVQTTKLPFEFKAPDLAQKVRENSTIENVGKWMKAELNEAFAKLPRKHAPAPSVFCVRIKEDSRSVVEV